MNAHAEAVVLNHTTAIMSSGVPVVRCLVFEDYCLYYKFNSGDADTTSCGSVSIAMTVLLLLSLDTRDTSNIMRTPGVGSVLLVRSSVVVYY